MGHRYTCGKTHRGLRLRSGTLLMGYSWEVGLDHGGRLHSEGAMDLRAGVLRSTDNGETWSNGGDTHASYEKAKAGAVSGTDEPAIVELDDGSIYMLMRTGSTHLYEARSTDEGETWHDVQPSPLTGTNAPAALGAVEHGGKRGIVVVWDNGPERFPLCAAASFDGGRTWSSPRDIGFPYTEGQASYPSCVQAPDGTLLAVWQQDVAGGRDIRLARFSPEWLLEDVARAPERVASFPDGPVIVLFGDSTTAPRGPLRIFGRLLAEELPARGVHARIANAGVGGNTTAMARQRFEADVLSRKPALVVISFGINDSAIDVWKGDTEPRVAQRQYEENLRHFVHALRDRGTSVILMTPNPLVWTPLTQAQYGRPPYDAADPGGFNLRLRDYAEVVRTIGVEEGVPVIDVYRISGERAGEPGLCRLLLDGMHPNDRLHRIVADELLEIIPEVFAKPQD
jgi:lysophospholipase L1-like esterase